VQIRRQALDRILDHARADAPLECCGLLLGTAARIDLALPGRNVLASPTRFELDPADHFAGIRRARELGVEVVGAYHSHPASAAVPSPRDLAEASYPDFVYLIASPLEADVKAFRLVEGNFQAVALVPFS
jgi:proteasome lid subunit RPN8/RPN11